MSLRAYDDLAQYAGLSTISTISNHSVVGKVMAMAAPSRTNKALQRIIVVGCFLWVGFLFLSVFPNLDDNGFTPFVIFPLFCIGPFLIMVGTIGGYRLLMSTLVGVPQTLMSTVVLKRGDELEIHYRQAIKRNVTLKSMAFSLVLQESATYDQGSSTVTVTHDHVIAQDLDEVVVISSETGIDRKLTFTIPDDAMHTFEAYRNSLQWYVKVNFDIPNFPDYKKDYKIKVLAEVNDES